MLQKFDTLLYICMYSTLMKKKKGKVLTDLMVDVDLYVRVVVRNNMNNIATKDCIELFTIYLIYLDVAFDILCLINDFIDVSPIAYLDSLRPEMFD